MPPDKLDKPVKIPLEQAAADLSALADLIEEENVEPDAALLQVFGELKALQAAAVDRNFLFNQYLRSQIELAKDMVNNWKHRRDVMTNVMERHKERLKLALEQNPKVPFKGQHGRIALQKSPDAMNLAIPTVKKTFELIADDDIEGLSKEMCQKYFPQILVRTVNKEKIKNDLKAGVDVPFAHLKQTNHVRFKV
jgi:hypothetical protein